MAKTRDESQGAPAEGPAKKKGRARRAPEAEAVPVAAVPEVPATVAVPLDVPAAPLDATQALQAAVDERRSAVLRAIDAEPEVPPALSEILQRLPTEPGVYLMKDRRGKIVYVGKAQNLRNRVRSYFNRSGDNRPFVALLARLLGDIETIVTHNEKEALLLENNLIKQHRPRFNVKLVDDKNYLVLRLDPKAEFPRLEVTRRIREDGARYFGPYHSATSCRQTLQVVNRHFRLRTCTDQVLHSRKRPCLQYQIKRCDAPCVFPLDPQVYAEQVRDVTLFLSGKDQELTGRLRERMMQASDAMEFEVAAAIRDQLSALSRTLEEQRVVSAQFVDQDVFGTYREGDVLEIAVLHVRKGKLLGRRTYHFSGQEFPTGESVSSFVGLYYDLGNVIPDEILLPCEIEDREAKEEWLRERASGEGGRVISGQRRKRVEILTPQRGPRAKLCELANKNAEVAYKSRRDKRRDTEDALGKLQTRLGLRRYPRWIECFDISHLQGTFTVASRVVFIDGEPARSEYRTFKVKTVENNDFGSMYEVLSRRLRRGREWLERSGGPSAMGSGEAPAAAAVSAVAGEASAPAPLPGGGDSWRLPDLLVIDGGKGQLGVALAALKDVGVDLALLDVIGLAKERDDVAGARHPDRVFLPRVKDPVQLRPNTAELFVLSRIRDEAHRFAVTFHKKQRARGTIRSALADIPGIGPRRQRELLRTLGSVRRIKTATLEELLAVPGMTQAAAEAVRQHFSGAAPGADDGAPEQPELADSQDAAPDDGAESDFEEEGGWEEALAAADAQALKDAQATAAAQAVQDAQATTDAAGADAPAVSGVVAAREPRPEPGPEAALLSEDAAESELRALVGDADDEALPELAAAVAAASQAPQAAQAAGDPAAPRKEPDPPPAPGTAPLGSAGVAAGAPVDPATPAAARATPPRRRRGAAS